MTQTNRGVFVALAGLGGAGKTTTTRRLTEALTERGYRAHATTEPSRAQLGEIARHGTETYSGYALACLVAADRYHHLTTEIRPLLAAGTVVVCDRYVASSYVLQRMDGVPVEFAEALNAEADVPDLTVILTADPQVTAARIARRARTTGSRPAWPPAGPRPTSTPIPLSGWLNAAIRCSPSTPPTHRSIPLWTSWPPESP